ncbi:hypothetical protein [Pedobacter sp. Hv1]|uniref:hypothetical protein n=1 Tax=Pedobacter sp. Hv1 TaxID=1740090 RepID=UPI0006D8C1C6|nr:hypothetical protein [Pedobacter sp. Hv1]KQB98837.1 hypothetical protein AQF98_21080 [Pedobacter sp. Hv1]
MKKQLLTAIAVCVSLCGYAQTKGTNALGFGINSFTQKSSGTSGKNEINSNFFSFSYGHFIKENVKLGIDLNYGKNEQKYASFSNQMSKIYGGNINYQRYFPIVKTLYAYAGGKGGYTYTESSAEMAGVTRVVSTGNEYAIGAYGGVTWFVSKRLALETSLLSANIAYNQTKDKNTGYDNNSKTTQTTFNMSTQGFINNLSFKIYLLF